MSELILGYRNKPKINNKILLIRYYSVYYVFTVSLCWKFDDFFYDIAGKFVTRKLSEVLEKHFEDLLRESFVISDDILHDVVAILTFWES